MRDQRGLLAAMVLIGLVSSRSVYGAGVTTTSITIGGGVYDSVSVTREGVFDGREAFFALNLKDGEQKVSFVGNKLMEISVQGTPDRSAAYCAGIYGGTIEVGPGGPLKIKSTAQASLEVKENTTATITPVGQDGKPSGDPILLTNDSTARVYGIASGRDFSDYHESQAEGHYNTIVNGDVDIELAGGAGSRFFAAGMVSDHNDASIVNGNANIYGNFKLAGPSEIFGMQGYRDALNKITGNAKIELHAHKSEGPEYVMSVIGLSADAETVQNIVEGNLEVIVESAVRENPEQIVTKRYRDRVASGIGGNSFVGGDLKILAIADNDNNAGKVGAGGVAGSTVKGNVEITALASGGGKSEEGTAQQRVLATGLGGGMTLSKNVFINTQATAAAGVPFAAISVHAFGDKNEITAPGNYVRQLQGDVIAQGYGEADIKIGTNNILLATEDSYLQGNIISAALGNNNLTLTQGGTWRPVYDNRYGTDCETKGQYDLKLNVAGNKTATRATTIGTTIILNKDGLIDLTWDGWNKGSYDTTRKYRSKDKEGFRTLSLAKLSGEQGFVRVDTDLANSRADVLTLGAQSDATTLYVQVNYDDFYDRASSKEILKGSALVVEDASGKLTVKGAASEYNEKQYLVTIAADPTDKGKWNLVQLQENGAAPIKPPTKPTEKPEPYITENTKQAADARDNNNNLWLLETNSLRKRLGEINREINVAEETGNIWGQYARGKQSLATGRRVELQHNSFRLGYDRGFELGEGKLYRGAFVSRIDGDGTYERGSGTHRSTTLGLYQTWQGAKGHYYDVVLRQGKLTATYNVTDLSSNYSTANYASWLTTLSGEYGYKKDLGSNLYLEPSGELIVGRVGGASFTTSKKMAVTMDATRHLVTRVGLALSKQWQQQEAYVKFNYYHDFAGGGGVTTGTVRYEKEQPTNWWEIGVGGQLELSKDCQLYGEIYKNLGAVRSSASFSLGARWRF